MSTHSEVDLFEDIDIPQKDFWEQILFKENQKSPSKSHIEEIDLKLEPISDTETSVNSDNSVDSEDDIEVVFEKKTVAQDFFIQGKYNEFKVHSIPHQNQLTASDLDVESPLGCNLSNKVFTFRKGFNLHTFYLQWGQIDQLCLRKQRYLRLMTLSNMIKQDEHSNEAFNHLHRRFKLVNKEINAKIRQIRHDHNKINEIIIQKSEAEKLQALKNERSPEKGSKKSPLKREDREEGQEGQEEKKKKSPRKRMRIVTTDSENESG